VAKQIVLRANKSSREFGQFFEVLGLTEAETEAEMREQIEERKAATPRGAAKRAALVQAMELKNYEFNAHGVELGQFYESTAVVPDGSTTGRNRPATRVVLRTVHRARLAAAARVGRRRRAQAVHAGPRALHAVHADHRDRGRGLGGGGRGRGGGARRAAGTVVIGPGREVTDLYYDWARLREVEEDGALLVRPDKHIGWRSMTLPQDPERELRAAMASLLGK
jgi:2,4-dichlorophenol 6-monooxygenase